MKIPGSAGGLWIERPLLIYESASSSCTHESFCSLLDLLGIRFHSADIDNDSEKSLRVSIKFRNFLSITRKTYSFLEFPLFFHAFLKLRINRKFGGEGLSKVSSCHPEWNEGSGSSPTRLWLSQMLRAAQHDSAMGRTTH